MVLAIILREQIALTSGKTEEVHEYKSSTMIKMYKTFIFMYGSVQFKREFSIFDSLWRKEQAFFI